MSRILLIEDHERLADLICKGLAGAGVVVLELGLAREADLCDSVCEGETRAVLARVNL